MGMPFYNTDNRSFSALRGAIDEKSCPCCRKTGAQLKSYLVITVKSFLLFTFNRKEIIIGCQDCITSSARKANMRSLLFGWWGVPLGPLSTILSVMHNRSAFSSSALDEPDEELMEYLEGLS